MSELPGVEGGGVCEEHGEALVWERGGPDMPTIHGRWYCLTCQAVFMEVLDRASKAGDVIRRDPWLGHKRGCRVRVGDPCNCRPDCDEFRRP